MTHRLTRNTRRPVESVIIGIDVGLSYLKVAAFDASGKLVAHGKRAYQTRRVSQNRIEEDPDEWIALSGDLVQEFLRQGAFRPDQVAGISTSGRGSGAVFVDGDGNVLRPHWLDHRSADQSRRIRERFGPYADNRSLPSKTLYLAETEPELFARLQHPLYVKDFILYRLSGEVATDPSSGPRDPASGPGLASWSRDVWDFIGFPVERVPPVRPHTAIGGYLLPSMAERFGLLAGIPVGIGGHDGACANAGSGAIAIGQVCLTLGTNGVARSIAAEPAPTVPWRGISAYHFLPGRWCCGGDAALLGHAPTWLVSLFGEDHVALEPAARAQPPGADGVIFLPFLNGQVSPDARPDRRAAFLGLSGQTDRATCYRAVLEGTSALIRVIADRLSEHGLGTGDWRVSGGGGNNRLWLEIIASMLNRPLLVVEPEECPRGAAMFLAVGLGWFESVEECAADWVRTVDVVTPEPSLVDAYGPLVERFRYFSEAVYAMERGAAQAAEERG